jgi:Mg-chelatase subunit ChlI
MCADIHTTPSAPSDRPDPAAPAIARHAGHHVTAYGRPSLTSAKLRRVELLAGAPRRQRRRRETTRPYHRQEVRDRERELSAQAERAYQRVVADWQRTRPKGAGAAPGRASQRPSTGQAARQTSAPTPAL